MKLIDPYSYQCGIIDCFNEMIRAGLKRIALSHPTASVEERDALIPFSRTVTNRSFSSFTKPRDLSYRLLEKRRRLERISQHKIR